MSPSNCFPSYRTYTRRWVGSKSLSDLAFLFWRLLLQNLPALVKNALEWLVTSGELRGKAVLPVTFCPHPPRGAEAMQAMIWSLQALDARIVGQLPLYQNEMHATAEGYELDEELCLLLAAALEELVS